MSTKELEQHIRNNVNNEYSAMVVVAFLYKKIYGTFPSIGLSGQQAAFAESMLKELPKKHKKLKEEK